MCYSNAIATGMGQHPVYLWTLPMFHCNGWCFPWSISLLSGTHVCLRAVRAKPMYDAIAEHRVTHLSGAPFVMSALLNAGDDDRRMFPQRVAFSHAAAPPPAAVLAKMDESGFELTHLYGLTETYGPATLNEWHAAWDELPAEDRLGKRIRQGVRYHALEDLTVMDPETMQKTPADGETLGEVMFRGNIVMKGYLQNQKATDDAFAGGWFHSGDLGVMHPDGYIQLKGPLQGHHHLGRREHLLDRGGGRALQAPRRRRGRGGRQARSEMGRDAVRLRRAQAGRDGHARRRSSPGARRSSPATNARAASCSSSCPRPRPARSRNSSCAIWRKTRELSSENHLAPGTRLRANLDPGGRDHTHRE